MFTNTTHKVPSMENSYILLWTALESIMGQRDKRSDIDVIKENVSKTISIGAVGRRINGFTERYLMMKEKMCWNILDMDNVFLDTKEGGAKWLEWLIKKYDDKDLDDPFVMLKTCPLLCKIYRDLNENLFKNNDLVVITKNSRRKVEYQLERLYLMRNSIVHSGKFNKNNSYLWGYLEWYIGKLLAQFIVLLSEISIVKGENVRDNIFAYMQGQYDSIINYLEVNGDEEITLENILASQITDFPILSF